jgi:methylase of polypeptide subunit release factors
LEKDRLDIFHKFFLVALRDALHSAPLHNQETPRILDIGCGTGIWAIDMAE